MIRKIEPLLSVCVITYNHEGYIRANLNSILNQECDFDFEIVIGEDCSTDATRQICEEYAKNNPRIVLLPSDKNMGMIPNFLRTIDACKGKYIAFCEGDDYWIHPLKMQKQVDFLEKNSEYGLTYGIAKLFIQSENEFRGSKGTKEAERYVNLLCDFQIHTSTVMLCKSLLAACNNEFNEFAKDALFYDYFYWLWFSRNSKIKYINEEFSVWRILSESGCHIKESRKSLKAALSGLEMRIYFILKYPIDNEDDQKKIWERIREEFLLILDTNYYIGSDDKSKSLSYRLGNSILLPLKMLKKIKRN